jgi:hypothetical protein
MSHFTRTQRMAHAQARLAVLRQEQEACREAYLAAARDLQTLAKRGCTPLLELPDRDELMRPVRERWLGATRHAARQERRMARLGG